MAATIRPAAPATQTPSGSASQPTTFDLTSNEGRDAIVWLLGLAVLLIFAFWETLETTALQWSQPQYSHGWVIPLIGAYILWSRRPNKKSATNKLFQQMKPFMLGVGLVAGVGAFTLKSTLIGGGFFALLCLMLFGSMLNGQPFARFSLKHAADVSRQPLWIITLGGALLTGLGLLALAGIKLPGPHPGHIQVGGLLLMMLAGIGYATIAEKSNRSSLPEMAFGVTLMLLSIASWTYAVQISMEPLSRIAFITSLIGAISIVGGLRLLQWAGPAVAFVLFMFPLPTIIEGKALGGLQKIAVRGSEVVHTVMGTQVIREGNNLIVEGMPMNVAEACSGLAMSTILIAMAVAMALLINRPWWDKLIVLLSAFPIAVISNIFRIVVIGLLWVFFDSVLSYGAEEMESFKESVHDFSGILLMMPFALGLYVLEFKLLSLLTVQEQELRSSGGGALGARPSTPPAPLK